MKLNKILIIVFTSTLFFGFSSLTNKKVNVEKSIIKWVGYKLTGQHEGTITIKEGELNFENESLKAGAFVMDMNSISTTDLEGGSKNRLDGHLKNEDFFDVEKYQTASLKFKTVKPTSKKNKDGNNYFVVADMTIKGITNEVFFKMTVFENSATANLKIDRTKFNITYKSATLTSIVKDKAIYDEFDLSVKLSF
tara:strand:- start:161 stop:742 length:582 start_codon:yes stop_codon:yes gene_type:complete